MSTSGTTDRSHSVNLLVIFGRPGAGKTTVSEKVIELLVQETSDSHTDIHTADLDTKSNICKLSDRYTQVDLDVCVPQWMRDNFAKGMYPTLAQRQEFALGACDYVDQELKEFIKKLPSTLPSPPAMIISFSFVNTDLRDTFRSRFPHATWILVDTSDEISLERIQMRQGHFYKGAPPPAPSAEDTNATSTSTSGETKSPSNECDDDDDKVEVDQTDIDNSEWDFAPVSFDHVILDGLRPIEVNAKHVIEIIKESNATSCL